ncbi:hypothetical protein Y886_03100 [Xanthomonas hyacinthi DSM 19077]|nr:hypothetical protein [Xanthomonas hyacinthi]KLD79671.1 hypothetical protein Y886_03100 [Xanthomonas hyacinthi DSM 19077]
MRAQHLPGELFAAQQIRPALCGRRAGALAELDDDGAEAAILLQRRGERGLLPARRGTDVFAAQGGFGKVRIRLQALHLRDRAGGLQHPLQRAFAQDQVAGLVVSVPQQSQHDVVGLPAQQVGRCADVLGRAAREGAPEETLRPLVVEEPGQAREHTAGAFAMQQGRTCDPRREQVAVAAQSMQLAERLGLALHADAEQRPAISGTPDLAAERVARGAGLADPHHAVARGQQQARRRRLAASWEMRARQRAEIAGAMAL